MSRVIDRLIEAAVQAIGRQTEQAATFIAQHMPSNVATPSTVDLIDFSGPESVTSVVCNLTITA